MKILFMGDASNCHAALGSALRRMGHDVTVASNGNYWMSTKRDVDISRRDGKIGGAWLWLKLNTVLYSRLRGFDIVVLSNPVFIEQRPVRVARFLDRLRRDNGSVFLTALGTDTHFIDLCCDPAKPLRYSEWRMPDGSVGAYARESQAVYDAWHTPPLRPLVDKVYGEVDGVVSVLYEYYLSALRALPPEKVVYGGIPIDLTAVAPDTHPINDKKINLFLGRHRHRISEKGTDRLEKIARTVVESAPDRFSLQIVENVPYAEYNTLMHRADVVLDQYYSYTPSTNALLAMAMGKAVVSGGEPEFYDFIGERDLRPVINVIPDRDDECVERLLSLDRDEIRALGVAGRQFVAKHNESELVAQRFIDFWQSHLHRV